ncbi:MAG: hypothetical protein QXT02_02960 [Candidatus Hadarchaeum sp.]|uniref:matrixin family metalloprotease n=1 Tax=Candidatus Hadarchaeum sp. TaxID=2883567 RepID=UPI003172215C
MKRVLPAMLFVVLLFGIIVVPVLAKSDSLGPPDIAQKIFIHRAKPDNPGKGKPGGEEGFYKLLGAKWKSFPVHMEVNPANPSGLGETFVLTTIGTAAEEWDDGAYSGWGGVPVDLFDNTITITIKGYDDLAWTSDKLDGKNTIVWGNYPTSGVIAVTIVWYNTKTKTILEFDMVLDTDYAWGDSTTMASVMDLQNIVTHELGHGAGLDDLYQDPAYQETMYGYSDLGEIVKRNLYTGDKAGITKLYD